MRVSTQHSIQHEAERTREIGIKSSNNVLVCCIIGILIRIIFNYANVFAFSFSHTLFFKSDARSFASVNSAVSYYSALIANGN